MATAEVSEPPRPSVVMLPFSSTPWKPATTTAKPLSRSRLILPSSMLTMRALVKALSVRTAPVRRYSCGLDADVHQRHRQQADRHLLAGRGNDIQFAGIGVSLNFLRQRDQPVGLAAHGGDHHHDPVSLRLPAGDAPGDVLDPLGRADRGAAVLLNYKEARFYPIVRAAKRCRPAENQGLTRTASPRRRTRAASASNPAASMRPSRGASFCSEGRARL
jgi:hypothetical protein